MADPARRDLSAPARRAGRLLLLPTIVVIGLFLVVPLVMAVALSFTSYDLLSAPRWVGLANFQSLLADAQFHVSIVNTLVFAFGQVVIGVVVALFVALLFNRPLAGGPLMRTFIYLPQAMSYVTVALLWSFLYDPTIGPISRMVTALGFNQINFLTDANTAMPSIMAMSLWRNLGYYMIILLAGLKAVPPELLEAAQIDGAGWWSRLFHVTLPQLRSPLFFVVVTWFMGGLQMFTQSYVMTQGGPVNSTRTVVYSLYEEAFLGLNFGKASAVGVLMLLAVVAVALPAQLIRQRGSLSTGGQHG